MHVIRADPSTAVAAVVLAHVLLLCTAGLPGSAAALLDRTTATANGQTPTTATPPGDAEGSPSATAAGIRNQDVEPSSPAVERGQWVQRVRPVVRNRSLQLPAPAAAGSARGASTAALPLGRVIANVLYGAPWPVPSRVDSRCADDVRIYNNDLQNFTLWAAKSE